MYVNYLTGENYGPFKGKFGIPLQPNVYGVIGRHHADPGRSNWLGKSWALGMIRFALYGAHNSDTGEDGIIHTGEDKCHVEITMDDGTVVERSRKRGKSTQLTYTPKGSKPATQKRAQELIDDYMKMSLEDFDASCFIEQKQISRMVTATPADRTKIVNAWLELGPLQDSAGFASDHLRGLLSTKAQNAQAQETTLAAFKDFEVEQAREECDRLKLAAEGMVDLRRILKDDIREQLEWYTQKVMADEFEVLLVEGNAKAAEIAEFDAKLVIGDSEEDLERVALTAAIEVSDAQRTYYADEALAKGEFDGQCPVMKLGCPSYDSVVETKGDAKRRLPGHVETCASRKDAYNSAQGARSIRDALARERNAAEQRLNQIRISAKERATAADFIAEHAEPADVEALQAQEEGYDSDIANMKADLKLTEAQVAEYDAAMLATEKHGPAAQKLDDKIRTAREAVAILGRGGAQKEIASTALAAIETLANGLLSKASIDLTLSVRWAREGKGLATHCDACGTPFGTSTRIKACPSCNTARGPKMIEKLELELSNRSGAADDMAGLAFQLAASSWLRQRRGSDWSVVFIDEPFSALDETNSANLSNHLHALIRGQFGFSQGFIVAHSPSIMGAMPARVVITSDGTSSGLGVE